MSCSHPTQRWWLVACGACCLAGCVSLPSQSGHAGQLYEPTPTQRGLSQLFQAAVQRHHPASGFHLVSAGVDGLLLRLELIERAQSDLNLQYYIFRSDDSGKRLQLALLHAADRGVHVRIISDDGETVPGDEKLLLLSLHPGIEVRIFNPTRAPSMKGCVQASRCRRF
jgi:putative cardiolipin synthase